MPATRWRSAPYSRLGGNPTPMTSMTGRCVLSRNQHRDKNMVTKTTRIPLPCKISVPFPLYAYHYLTAHRSPPLRLPSGGYPHPGSGTQTPGFHQHCATPDCWASAVQAFSPFFVPNESVDHSERSFLHVDWVSASIA